MLRGESEWIYERESRGKSGENTDVGIHMRDCENEGDGSLMLQN